MLEFIKRFLHFAEFFKSRSSLHHSRKGFLFEQEFELSAQDSRDIAGFFEKYLISNGGKIFLNTSLLEQFTGWDSFLRQFYLWVEDYFLTADSGIISLLDKYSEFDYFSLQDWTRCMGYNFNHVKKCIRFLEIFGLIRKHRNRFHVVKNEILDTRPYGDQCLYFLPNFEVILLNPVDYHIVITLLHLFEFRKMNYEVVFHINQEYLYKIVQGHRELDLLSSLFRHSLNEIPENIIFLSRNLEEQLKKIRFTGAGFYFKLSDIHTVEHLEQFLNKYPGKYHLEKEHLFVHVEIIDEFYRYLDENTFSYFKPDGVQEQNLNRFLERMDSFESQFIWKVCTYFSIMINRIKILEKADKNSFDRLYQYLGLIYKNEHNLSEKELNVEKKSLREQFEQSFSEHLRKMASRVIMDSAPPAIDSRFWRTVRHAVVANRAVCIVLNGDKKRRGKKEMRGYITAVNQLGFLLKAPHKNKKNIFILWNSIENIVLQKRV